MTKKKSRGRRTSPDRPQRPATVFVAGCFNRVHKAHMRMLRLARTLGDRLLVLLAHDAHNHKPNAVPARLRRRRLLALGVADRVTVGSARGFAARLRQVRPDILALGYDQRLPDAQTEAAVRELGIRVCVLPWSPGKEEHHACQHLF